ncbi:ABC transporter permease [Siculibacillus lacustris]|uniref:ABC transporter permease n=1 Tax=Siculibacillus lacustris TaxID=1549641 RepID=A0A4Q9VUT3_9HYPH|nr:ABC transporter permease [Siculibacillus lacustris]TBW39513.1 ABC transporter permease [Siculibacillus lacustris]
MTALRPFLATYGTALAGLAVVVVFALLKPVFLTPANFAIILKETAFLGILSLGFTLALVTAELDLSIAEVASLSAVVTGALVHAGFGATVAVAAGLSTGLVCGAANGLVVTRLRVPSLIATLGMAAIAKGLGFMITQGVAFVGRWPVSFTGLARGSIFGLSNLAWWLAGTAAACWVLLDWTRIGAHLRATGEAEEAARLAGVATGRMKRAGLTMCGLGAGLTGVLLAASLSSAAPNMAGDHFLYAIAAVLLGMTMFEPGRPNVPGTLVAAFSLKALGNGLVLVGAAYYVQDIVLGLVIVASVALSAGALGRAAFVEKLNFKRPS